MIISIIKEAEMIQIFLVWVELFVHLNYLYVLYRAFSELGPNCISVDISFPWREKQNKNKNKKLVGMVRYFWCSLNK